MFNAQLPWQLKKLSYPETGWISDSRLDKASHAKHPFFPLSCLLCFPGWRTDRNPEQGEAGVLSEIQGLSAYASRSRVIRVPCFHRARGGWLLAPGESAAMAPPFPDEPSVGGPCILAAGSWRPPRCRLTHSGPLSASLSPGLMLHFFHFFFPRLFPMLLTMPRTLALCSYQIWNYPHSFRRHMLTSLL